MHANLAALIAGLGGTALGGLIAATAGWWQGNRQRQWQLEDSERTEAAVRAKEVRERADTKVDDILTHLGDLEAVLFGRI